MGSRRLLRHPALTRAITLGYCHPGCAVTSYSDTWQLSPLSSAELLAQNTAAQGKSYSAVHCCKQQDF